MLHIHNYWYYQYWFVSLAYSFFSKKIYQSFVYHLIKASKYTLDYSTTVSNIGKKDQIYTAAELVKFVKIAFTPGGSQDISTGNILMEINLHMVSALYLLFNKTYIKHCIKNSNFLEAMQLWQQYIFFFLLLPLLHNIQKRPSFPC